MSIPPGQKCEELASRCPKLATHIAMPLEQPLLFPGHRLTEPRHFHRSHAFMCLEHATQWNANVFLGYNRFWGLALIPADKK